MKKRILILSALALSYSAFSFAESTVDVSKPIATINGVGVSEAELNYFISKLSQKVPAERALQEIINVELLVQAAKNEGLMKNDELVLEIKRSTSGLIATHYLQQQLLKLEVTIEDLKARYNKDYVEANQAKEYNANHILVKTEEEATDIIQKLDGGAVFTELAKTLSTGPSGKSGGALGWFKSSDMVPPFSAATMKLELKQYTKQPVKSQFGWHIIYLNDTRATEPPAFESVSKELSSKIAGEEISKIMQQLHESATIVFPDK